MANDQSRELNYHSKASSSDAGRTLSEKNSEILKSKKTSLSKFEPKSAQELCDQLQAMVLMEEWDKSLAEKFAHIVVNPDKHFQLNTKQKQSLVDSILTCPSKYRSLVHLLILSKNFVSQRRLYTVEGITTEIVDFIKSELALESRIEGTLLKVQGDQVLLDWLKGRLNVKGESLIKKLDLIRNLVSYLVGSGETIVISSRLDIIIEAFAGSSYLQQYIRESITLEKTTQHRVKAIVDLFCLDNPTTAESERLILFGSSANNLVISQAGETSQLRTNFENERQASHKKDKRIADLEIRCRDFENEIAQIRSELEREQDKLKQEEVFYKQLKASSTAKISQQRNSVLSQMKSRIEHELLLLERCLNGKADSFAENSQMGLEIINNIRDRLSE